MLALRVDAKYQYLHFVCKWQVSFLREISHFLKLLFEFAYLKTPCFSILDPQFSCLKTLTIRDELPVAFLHIARTVHAGSENEEPSDNDSSASEDSSDETEDEDDNTEDGNDQDYSNLRWSCHIQAPRGMDFKEDVGIKVDMPANSTCFDYFHQFFTDHVYQLIE